LRPKEGKEELEEASGKWHVADVEVTGYVGV
jgi:hypothetical protein